MRVPFLDIQGINQRFKGEFDEVYKSLISKGQFIYGEHYERFCDNFKKYLGSQYAIGVGNGYDALYIIFRSLIQLGHLKEGEEVLVPSNSYIASATAISANKLVPVFIEPKSDYNFNFSNAKKQISKRTKACLIVHLFGQTSWDNDFEAFCKEKNILIIEDCAQSIGSTFNDVKTGNLGFASAFSFYPGKNLGALGDGGAIATNNTLLYNTVKELANYGSKVKYIHNSIGLNSRLDEIQAGFLDIKLKRIEQDNQKRKKIAHQYLENINNEFISLPKIEQDHVYHLFVIRTKTRTKLMDYLKSKNIETLIHYPYSIPNQRAYNSHFQYNKISNAMHDEILSIPISPIMTDDQVNWVIDSLNFYNEQ